jgi:cytochrome c biogenesis protein CcmG/thiol:disulfide interchange protein DsbE
MGRTTPAAKARHRQRQARRRRRGRVALAGAASVAAVLVIGALAWSLAGAGGTASSRSGTAGNTAAIDATSAAVGKPFPDFAVTGPDGRTITNASLQGRPSMVWLTTLGCVPVQAGAPKLARLDDQLGGTAPQVLVIFVDPAAPAAALTRWHQRFANLDWRVAHDDRNRLASAVRLRYDDTKFLLDSHGRILDVNVWPVDEHYLQLVRARVAR